VKRAVLYMRVSSLDQHPDTQLHDLRQMAVQRGYELVKEFTDRISGAKARRPGLDDLMRDARHGCFDVASDRIARSVNLMDITLYCLHVTFDALYESRRNDRGGDR